MEELVSVMEDIRDLLSDMNDKLDDIRGDIKDISSRGKYTLSDVCNKLNDIEIGIWNSRKSVSNDAIVSLNHNYTLAYTKNITAFIDNKAKFKFADDGSGFDNPDNDPRGLWKADPFDSPGIRPNLTYAITNPNTGEVFYPPKGRCWRTGEKEYLDFLKAGRIILTAFPQTAE